VGAFFVMAEEKPIIDVVNDLFDDNQNPIRKVMERIWFRNILYYLGEQWIDWIVSSNTFRRKSTHPLMPTPVSNIIRDYIRTIKAMILNKKMSIRIWPNSTEEEDRQAAELGENLLQWMDTENDGYLGCFHSAHTGESLFSRLSIRRKAISSVSISGQ